MNDMTGKRGKRQQRAQRRNEDSDDQVKDKLINNLFHVGEYTIGISFMVVCWFSYAKLVHEQRDARYFISGIKEVEREISMRTEQGLYYSYYKQLVHSHKGFIDAVGDLTRDNLTEFPSQINVLQRMNIYQEVILAWMFRSFSLIHGNVEPFLFYSWSVLALNGFMLACMFGISWILSSTWSAGLLTVVFYQYHALDTNRLAHAIGLRESFALPFLWCHILSFTVYLRADKDSVASSASQVALMASSLLFSLFWQFNQFALLFEILSVVILSSIGILSKRQAQTFYSSILFGILTTAILQFGNTMLLSSFCLGFTISAVIINHIGFECNTTSFMKNLARLVLRALSFILISALIIFTMRSLFQTDSDSHIFTFVKRKFGFSTERTFDVRLYECLSIFDWIGWEVFANLRKQYLLYLYFAVHLCWTVQIGVAGFKFLSGQPVHPDSKLGITADKAFNSLLALLFSSLAIYAMRMKYFWIPYMCIIGPVAFSWLGNVGGQIVPFLHKLSGSMIRHSLMFILICSASLQIYKEVQAELNTLQEFWDPDTVELMEWISNSTSPDSSFSGSMQLMAGVKACTERPISNHPHFEDAALRNKTHELYQMYARKSPQYVHEILRRHQVSFIILEDSICMIPSRGCRLPDIMDELNGEVPDHGQKYSPHLKHSSTPRFCDEIRQSHHLPRHPFAQYFRLVLMNRTFRVYRVL